MKKTLRLGLLIFLCSASMMFAQNAKVYLQIEPMGDPAKPLLVEPGKVVHFTAKAYELSAAGVRHEVSIDQITWSVDPQGFGTITTSGDFTLNAIMPPGIAPQAKIIANATVANQRLTSTVLITTQQGPIDLKLEYTFSGTVSDNAGNPIAHAKVVAYGANAANSYAYSTETGADGKYTIKTPAGSFVLRVTATGFISEYYDNVATFDKATVLKTDATNKNVSNINFTLGTGGKISGKVTAAADGSPVKGATVKVIFQSNAGTPVDGTDRSGYAISDANGDYIISGLSSGKYNVQAHADRYALQYYDKVFDLKSATLVEVTDGTTTGDINFLLEKGNIDPVNPFTISGIVKDGAGNPVAGAYLFASNPVSMQPSTNGFAAKSEADGKYTIKVPAGPFIVNASAHGFISEYYDNVFSADLAKMLTLSSTQKSYENIDFILSTGGKISGVVKKASDQSPIKGAWVSLYAQSTTRPPDKNISGVQTNENGEYTISGLAPGSYFVVARKDMFQEQYFDNTNDPKLATKVDVVDGQTTSNINFSLRTMPGQTIISGKVIDQATNASIAGAAILLQGGTTASGAILMMKTVTDKNGEYQIPLPVGKYKAQATASHYSAEWYNEKATATLADEITVATGGDITGINFTLEKFGGAISGIVKDESGNPIERASVRVWYSITTNAPRDKNLFATSVTDANGIYKIEGLATGKYTVIASAKGFVGEFYNNVTDPKLAAPVDVVNNQTTTGIDFALAKGGSISGKVIDAKTNTPIVGAFVSIRSNASLVESGAKTDANGDYTLSGLASGDYVVFAAANKYKGEYFKDAADPKTATPVKVAAPDVTSGIDFTLEVGSPIKRKFTGTVLDAHSQAPTTFTVVEVVDPTTGKSTYTSTDDRGRFEIYGETESVIRARAIGYIGSYANNQKSWTEGKSGPNSGEIFFALNPMVESGLAVVRGVVADEASKATISNAWVFGVDTDGNEYFSYTNGKGEYCITGAPIGKIDLMLSGVNYEQMQGSATVDGFTNNNSTMYARRKDNTLSASNPTARIFELSQNYPNPFNPTTTIGYSIPTNGIVTLRIFDLLGHEVTTLVSGFKEAGSHTANWNASKVPSGTYLYKLEANGKTITRKMTLMK